MAHCLFPPIASRQKRLHALKKILPSAICYHEKCSLLTYNTGAAVYAKTAYRRRDSFWISPSTIHFTQYLLDTVVELKLVNATLIPQPWQHRIKQRLLPNLQTATKQLMHIVDKILLHIPFWSVSVKTWFADVPELVVHKLSSTSFIDWFIRGILLFERTIVSWHSHPVAILSTHHHQKPTTSQNAARISESTLTDHADKSPTPIRIV